MIPTITGNTALNFTNKHSITSAAQWAAEWKRVHGEAIPPDRAERIWTKVQNIKALNAENTRVLNRFFGAGGF